MKTVRFLLLAALGGVLPESAAALTLPVSEDTFSVTPASRRRPESPEARQLTADAGRAKTLGVSSKRAAFIRFEIGDFAGDIGAATVDRALLMVYLAKVERGGAINLHVVSEDWSEAVTSARCEPGFNALPVATIPSESVRAQQFIVIDVTAIVKAWLNAPASDHGFALVGDATAKVEIGSREGPASGYPAILQVERKAALGAEENLRIVRGTVLFKDGVLSLVSGTGVTLARIGSEDIELTFTTPFGAPPTITLQQQQGGTTWVQGGPDLKNVTAASAVFTHARGSGNSWHFIAIGPR
jgi:hypothetical protein